MTYVSTSWRKEVAQHFMKGNDGMIITIDKEYKENTDVYCCDVSWISKFPDECEILFARSERHDIDNGFECKVMDESNGIQYVSLSASD